MKNPKFLSPAVNLTHLLPQSPDRNCCHSQIPPKTRRLASVWGGFVSIYLVFTPLFCRFSRFQRDPAETQIMSPTAFTIFGLDSERTNLFFARRRIRHKSF